MKNLILKNGLKAYNEKRYQDALKYFEKTKDEKKDYYLGLTYVKLEDYKTAITHLKKYLKKETNYSLMIQIYFILGFIYAQLNEYTKSLKYLQKVIDLDFNNSKAYAAIGYVYYKMKNFNESIKALKKAIEIDEENATAHNSLGFIYADINLNLQEAVRECEIALELSPEYPAYLDSMGWAYYKSGDLEKAKEYLVKAMDKMPDNEEIKKHFKDLIVKEMLKKREKID